MVPADSRLVDASLGFADVVDRPCAGASIQAPPRGQMGTAQTKAALFLSGKKRGPDLHPALRHWVMVGCLQGKTRASCLYKVNIWLTVELVLDLTANDS